MEEILNKQDTFFMDAEGFKSKLSEYDEYADSINKFIPELSAEHVTMTKLLFDDWHRKGTEVLIDAVKVSFEKQKEKAPANLRAKLVFNPAKYYNKFQNWTSSNNWYLRNLRIDWALFDVKNGQVFLPEKSKEKIRETFTVCLESNKQKEIADLIKRIMQDTDKMAELVKESGYDPASFVWGERFGLLYVDHDGGTIKANYLVLNAI